MTIQDKEIIQRALDIVEGAICIWLKSVRGMITTESEMIDEVLNKVVVAENATTTATNSKTERVQCADCKHLVYSDCYGECGAGHRGIVWADDTCPHGDRRADDG